MCWAAAAAAAAVPAAALSAVAASGAALSASNISASVKLMREGGRESVEAAGAAGWCTDCCELLADGGPCCCCAAGCSTGAFRSATAAGGKCGRCSACFCCCCCCWAAATAAWTGPEAASEPPSVHCAKGEAGTSSSPAAAAVPTDMSAASPLLALSARCRLALWPWLGEPCCWGEAAPPSCGCVPNPIL